MRIIRFILAVFGLLSLATFAGLYESASLGVHARRRESSFTNHRGPTTAVLDSAGVRAGSIEVSNGSAGTSGSRVNGGPGGGEEAPRILLVQGPVPEVLRVESLTAALGETGYEVQIATGASECLRRLQDGPDLVLLGTLNTGMPWTELCRQIRQGTDIPIVISTRLESELDAVLAFELGVTSYTTDASRIREVVARVRAALRPNSPPGAYSAPGNTAREHSVSGEHCMTGSLSIDLAGRDVTVNGSPVYLARREFDLLAALLRPPGRVRTRQELIDLVWRGRGRERSRTLDTHMRKLRQKLEPDPARPRHLVTVHGVGFRFDTEVDGVVP